MVETVDKDSARPASRTARVSAGLLPSVRLTAVLVAVIGIVAVGWYVWWRSVPTEGDLREQAHLKGKAELVIGVMGDVPGVALLDPSTAKYTGFDIDIGYLVAADLGFQPHQVHFVTIENEDRNRMRARDGDRFVTVDLVIAAYSVTAEREELGVTFSEPYLETEQSVMTLRGHAPVQDLTDLAGRSVCTISTSTSKVPAGIAGAQVVNKSTMSECIPGLRDREFEAITTDAPLIAGFVAAEPGVFEHHDIGLETPELWAINTGENQALLKLVNLSLYRSRHDPQDRRWEDAYDRNLRSLQRASGPQQVAIDEQPDVAKDKVEVRQWPWERLAGTIRSPLPTGPLPTGSR